MITAAILVAVTCLTFANGANDNFKGVATLFGSGTTTYWRALLWATITTLLGSLTAVFLAEKLLKNFSGRGLVTDSLAANQIYVAAVALGAGLTVLMATKVGMPISTTHSIVGALVGAGWAASSTIDLIKLGSVFLLPLLLSPIVAIVATSICYSFLRRVRVRSGIVEETCFCVGSEHVEIVPAVGSEIALRQVERLTFKLGETVTCRNRYGGVILGIEVGRVVDWMHFLSAGIVSYARGLNDTPKIAALLLLLPAFGRFSSTCSTGIIMALGGLIGARRVAEVMSRGITAMNHGQGLTANMLTGAIVIGASNLGLPVSTTHVSCGALFGIGAVRGRPKWQTIGKILLAWITTLPAAAILGAASFRLLNS